MILHSRSLIALVSNEKDITAHFLFWFVNCRHQNLSMYKLKTERSFGWKIDMVVRQVMIILTVKRKLKIRCNVLNLTYCFTLTFSQWHLVNLGVEIYFKMP